MSDVASQKRRPTIEPRDLHFDIGGESQRHWHSRDAAITHLFNGLSMMFPAGERFFMNAIRPFLKQIKDPKLRDEVQAFLSQEGIHSREHDMYNKAIRDQGYWTAKWLELATKLALDATSSATSAKWQLAITCAIEHLTAVFADVVLRDPRVLRDADPEYAALWRWHLVEETEHKSVAFDVYRTVAPGTIGYMRRVLVMWLISIQFFPYIVVHQATLLTHDDPFWPLKIHGRALRFFWWSPGLAAQGILSYLRYYLPDFHPWQHDNAELVAAWRRQYAPKPARPKEAATA
jgi:predicted metal-dependent hydrolase